MKKANAEQVLLARLNEEHAKQELRLQLLDMELGLLTKEVAKNTVPTTVYGGIATVSVAVATTIAVTTASIPVLTAVAIAVPAAAVSNSIMQDEGEVRELSKRVYSAIQNKINEYRKLKDVVSEV